MPEKIWVGIDVGESMSHLAAIDADDATVSEATLPTEIEAVAKFFASLKNYSVVEVALESGATGTHLVRQLRGLDLPAVVYEARRASKYLRVRLNKTDGNDARGLAEIAKLGRSSLTQVHLKSPEFQKIRSELAFRHKLTAHRIACESMIRSLIRLNGGRLKVSSTAATLEKHVREELDRMNSDLGVDLAREVEPLLTFATGLRKYLTILDRRLAAYAKTNPVCTRFMAIPGVGPICAVSFYSAIEDPSRFQRAGDVGPYLGLAPLVAQSGKSSRYGGISRRGNKLTRSHLTLAAVVLLTRGADNSLKSWGKSLAKRSGFGKAKVAVARKLAVLMLAMWKSGEAFDAIRCSLPTGRDANARKGNGREPARATLK